MTEHLIRKVSDTAPWVAAYRAEESERPDALFGDPYARELAGELGFEAARRVGSEAIRFAVVMRTAVLDEIVLGAVRERGFDAVLNLGAGLDSRPYRLDLPAGVKWVEVDLPGIVAHKEAVLASATPKCDLERVPLDLAEREARRGLFARVAGGSRRVLVVTEGLLGYLAAEEVAGLAEDLAEHAAFEEWVTDLVGAMAARRVGRKGDELKAREARGRFAPEEGTAFFAPHGWREAGFHDLFAEAPRFGRDSLAGKAVRLVMRCMPAEKRKRFERGVGVARLARAA